MSIRVDVNMVMLCHCAGCCFKQTWVMFYGRPAWSLIITSQNQWGLFTESGTNRQPLALAAGLVKGCLLLVC